MRVLTQAKFRVSMECHTKLYYNDKSYAANKRVDSFIKGLAQGGYQVGALARTEMPATHVIKPGSTMMQSVDQTREFLKAGNAVIHNATILYGNLYVRIDILEKVGDTLIINEVKSKTVDPSDPGNFAQKDYINADWKKHLYDVAFQKHVLQSYYPEHAVVTNLVLVDKTKQVGVDGMNQMFRAVNVGEDGIEADIRIAKGANLGESILCTVNVDNLMAIIFEGGHKTAPERFVDIVERVELHYMRDIKMYPVVGGKCTTCEYRIMHQKLPSGMRNGFLECWKEATQLTEKELQDPTVLELWSQNLGTKKDDLILNNKYFLREVEREDIAPRVEKESDLGMSHVDRKMMQVEKVKTGDTTPYVDVDGLREVMENVKFPLHMIDFETTTVAIPFNKGRKPYEPIAFQFSHHVYHRDGRVEHRGEWISTDSGKFPNFDFVRALKKSLDGDNGTIFRYASHENTILNTIYGQLRASDEPDRDLLCAWIKTITTSLKTSNETWTGTRNMVDMFDLVKKYYYHPHTKGSNSIKSVVEAVMSTNTDMQRYYGKRTFQKLTGSRNFDRFALVRKDSDGNVVSPYRRLPSIFEGYDMSDVRVLTVEDHLKDGGAAMTAYGRMQYTDMSEKERTAIRGALLKYCEIDTMSMVLLWEEFLSHVVPNKTIASYKGKIQGSLISGLEKRGYAFKRLSLPSSRDLKIYHLLGEKVTETTTPALKNGTTLKMELYPNYIKLFETTPAGTLLLGQWRLDNMTVKKIIDEIGVIYESYFYTDKEVLSIIDPRYTMVAEKLISDIYPELRVRDLWYDDNKLVLSVGSTDATLRLNIEQDVSMVRCDVFKMGKRGRGYQYVDTVDVTKRSYKRLKRTFRHASTR
jgi:hypothetical protein